MCLSMTRHGDMASLPRICRKLPRVLRSVPQPDQSDPEGDFPLRRLHKIRISRLTGKGKLPVRERESREGRPRLLPGYGNPPVAEFRDSTTAVRQKRAGFVGTFGVICRTLSNHVEKHIKRGIQSNLFMQLQ